MITMGIYVATLNSIKFLVTYSKYIKLCTDTEMTEAHIPVLVKLLTTVISIYRSRVFRIGTITADNIFNIIREDPDFITL